MPRLTPLQRGMAIGMLQAGQTPTAVARQLGCHFSTVTRLSQCHQITGSVNDRPRTGRPRVTTAAPDRYIRVTHLRNRMMPATRTVHQVHGPRGPVSTDTVRRRLRAAGLRDRRPYVGPILTHLHRQRRQQWAQQHQQWRRVQWQEVLFTDESRYNLSYTDGRIRVWRRRHERYSDCCVLQADLWGGSSLTVWGGSSLTVWGGGSLTVWGGGSLTVWGGFTFKHRAQLHVFRQRVNAAVYQNDVINNHVVPFFAVQPRVRLLHQDNARPHTAWATQALLAQHNIPTLLWPAVTPDMAPIEHVWDEIGRRLQTRGHRQNLPALEAALVYEWNILPQAFFQRLVNSMRRHTACLNARGGHARY